MTEPIRYKVSFYMEDDAELSIVVDSPLITSPDTEENVHAIVDMAQSIVKLKFGEDILETLKVWGEGVSFYREQYDEDDDDDEPRVTDLWSN